MAKNPDYPDFIPNNSDNTPVINSPRNRLAQGFWTPVSDIFFRLRGEGVLTAEDLSVSLMLLRYCNKNQLKFNFEMSRRELAMVANCNEKTAARTLVALVRVGLLKEVFKRKGCHSKYAWIVDNFQADISDLGTKHSGAWVPKGQDLSIGGTGPEYQRDNTCIVFIINIFLIRSGGLKSLRVENFNDADQAASYFDSVEAAWSAAIKKCCRAYGYDRTHLIIKNHEISFFDIEDPSKHLASLCRDPGLIADLRDRHAYFKSDREFSFYVEKSMHDLTRSLIKQDNPEWFPVQ